MNRSAVLEHSTVFPTNTIYNKSYYLVYFEFESLSAKLVLQTKIYISTPTNIDFWIMKAFDVCPRIILSSIFDIINMIIFIIFQDSPLAGFPQLVCVEAQKSKRAILPETELKIRNQRTAYFCSARENSWKSFSERARNLCVWKLIIIMKRWCERRCHSKWVQSWVFSLEKSGIKQNKW